MPQASKKILKYPHDLDENSFIRFAPMVISKVEDNKTSRKGYGKITQKRERVHYPYSIAFYLPNEIKQSMQYGWSEMDAGLIGRIANYLGNVDTNHGITGFAKSVGGEIQKLKNELGLGMLLGGEALQFYLARQGKALNPARYMSFSVSGTREYTFSFRLAPRNKKEAETIKEIIWVFKRYSAPRYGGAVVYFPPKWQVEIIVDGKQFIKFLPCGITTLEIDYTPEQVVSMYEDGNPVSVNLAIGLKELELYTGEKQRDTNSYFGL